MDASGRWPGHGPAIITPNHTSLLDGPALALLTPSPILFGVDPDYAEREPWRSILLTVGRLKGCTMVPMLPGTSRGLRDMLRALRAGSWVCLFPEGGIATGRRHPGAQWLADRTGAPIHVMRIWSAGPGKIRLPYRIQAG